MSFGRKSFGRLDGWSTPPGPNCLVNSPLELFLSTKCRLAMSQSAKCQSSKCRFAHCRRPNVSQPKAGRPKFRWPNFSQTNAGGTIVSEPNVGGPNVSWPIVGRSNVSQPNVSWPNVDRSNVGLHNFSRPNVGQSNVSWPNVNRAIGQMLVGEIIFDEKTRNHFLPSCDNCTDGTPTGLTTTNEKHNRRRFNKTYFPVGKVSAESTSPIILQADPSPDLLRQDDNK